MARNTVGVIIPEVLQTIVGVIQPIYLQAPQTKQQCRDVIPDFNKWWQFPNCFGALDGKHIAFRPPRTEKAFYKNYHSTESIVLRVLADANYKILLMDVGINGCISDGSVFAWSIISSAIYENKLSLPPAQPLPGRHMPVPHVLVADAFPLRSRILKPFPYRRLSQEKKIYNY